MFHSKKEKSHCSYGIIIGINQQKRHRCIEQSFGLYGRGRGRDDMGKWHWNMYNIIYETSHQSRFYAWYWMLGAGALGRPRGMVWGGRREEGSGWGTQVYLWQIHFDVWQNQYNIVKFKNKIKFKTSKQKNDITTGKKKKSSSIIFLSLLPAFYLKIFRTAFKTNKCWPYVHSLVSSLLYLFLSASSFCPNDLPALPLGH